MACNDGVFAPWHISVSFQGCAIAAKECKVDFLLLTKFRGSNRSSSSSLKINKFYI